MDFLKRSNASIFNSSALKPTNKISKRALFAVESDAKYEGYINIQLKKINKTRELEKMAIPPAFDYTKISNLSSEAKEKLIKIKPESLGQAMRIDGVRQSDASILSFHLYKKL